MMGNCRLE